MYKKALSHFKRNDPVIFSLALDTDPFELSVFPNPYVRLIRSILGQQLSVMAARTIFERFENLFPEKEILPDRVLKLSQEELRGCGISFQKISYLRDLSQKVIERNVDLNNFSDTPNEKVIETLTQIKGIGRWTAEMFLMFSLGRPDVFSYGDLGLQNAIKKAYNLDTKPNLIKMEKISASWIPYRTYAAMILWKSLKNEPK